MDKKAVKTTAQAVAKKEVMGHVAKLHPNGKHMAGGGVVVRGAGAATKGTRARGPMA